MPTRTSAARRSRPGRTGKPYSTSSWRCRTRRTWNACSRPSSGSTGCYRRGGSGAGKRRSRRGSTGLATVLQELLHHRRIKQDAGLTAEVVLRRLERQRSILGSLPVEFIKRVGQPDQTGEEWDGVAFQAIWVAGPVIPFVVVADDLTDCRRQGERLDHASADFRMKFDELVFAVRLPDDGRKQAFVNAELSDVVQQGADPDHFPLLLGQREPVRQQGGVTVHTVRM